ncbi:TPA: cysteine/glutathione ABC transporter permease/ATP-binding protein CydD [Salmonella enterica subsp. enterica serovar Chester]|uniref:Cysteine/glutathione ABC transporter permease/ATP-binding protein CydD n=4 Tax=Salmonella enterica TaxID=28901 RepID=A0A5V0LFQ9_SALER|nr:cysteine/glutathione ABC transporter permease/ATP-binding protein CydD [Salmonella enterica]EAB9989661.1 cysteine/glutathione ABC transporter permease/ATP-binding protein CydD [Salmonella enterica subsp. enterica serovar Eko]EAS5050909.1 cysteine/glutathione ABC transporter permease/ATP-binding protein CydD [Salmonella enterica subsp. enterica serovar Poona]EBV6628842.1 cysteine/glutathione ABC transporter permease/ATP-binding protein CydD [Salmonella enterica subsp. enterica serovar Saintpau
MNKTRQKELTRWLKQQSVISQRWLNISRLLGFMSGVLIVAQAWIMARILQHMIMENIPREALLLPFILLILVFVLRAWVVWLRERVGFHAGQHIRFEIRRQVLDRLQQAGPAWIQGKPAGSWATLVLEQIDDMHDYYARYLPQMALAVCVPLLIVAAIFPSNWAAALILLGTAPLIPLFMAMVGMGAADANRRNFLALARLSGHFLDRLRGMETLRIFGRGEAETENIRAASQDFRQRTMEVLRLAFLSSGVLEFFTSLSIALVAVYFGFSYLGELNFGHYGTGVTLTAGFLALILAPEFFQPLRDLGTFYHAKAQAVGAADSLKTFLETPLAHPARGEVELAENEPVTIDAVNLIITSPEGKTLAGPLNFSLAAGERAVLVGRSGSGKSSLLNVLSGFLSYQGSLRINGVELRDLSPESWRQHLSWVGQNPQLPAATLRENVLLARPDASEQELYAALDAAWVSEFLPLLPQGVDTPLGNHASRLSVGQAQRVAVARALLNPCQLLLLDEPAASLDAHSEQRVMQALKAASKRQTTLMVTHQLEDLADWDAIWVMQDGAIVEQGSYAELSAANGAFATLLAHRQEDI